MMNKPVIIFLLILYLLAGCQQKRQPLTKLLTPEDSVAVLQTVLSYAPLNSLMSEFKGDTLYIFDKKTAPSAVRLRWQGKQVLITEAVTSIPASQYSPNLKFYATFPMMQLAGDTLKTTIVFNDIGDTGLFYLVLTNNRWKIIKHEFGKI